MNPERWLPAALRREHDPEISRLLHGRPDVAAELLEAAVWHGVAPLLHRRLGPDRRRLPADVARRLEDLHAVATLRNRAFRSQFRELLDLVDGDDRVVVLKGADLTLRVYADPGVRDMGDIDLLLHPDAARRLQTRLVERGYSTRPEWVRDNPGHHLPRLERPGDHDVEIHTGIAPDDAPFRVDLQRLWTRVEVTEFDGRAVAHLAPDDALLHLCTHAAFDHRFLTGLQGLCDIDALAAATGSRLDWNRLVATARTDGRASYAYVALALAADLLGTAVPAEVRAALRSTPLDDEIVEVARAYVLDRHETLPTGFARARAAPTWKVRAGALLQSLFPGREDMRRIYGPHTAGLRLLTRWLARPFELLARRRRVLFDLLVGRDRVAPLVAKDARARRLRAWAERGSLSPPGSGS